jgi:hypothetical protein
VSFARGDEVPHIFTRNARLQLAEFLIIGAKRLLQHNRHLADKLTAQGFVAYWGKSGHRSALALNGPGANDHLATLSTC